MNEIICSNCKQAFKVNEIGFAFGGFRKIDTK